MSNGGPERFNQVLQNMITTYVSEKQDNWDQNLNLISSAYRSSVHDSTGFTPNMLMLGRETLIPAEISMGCIPENNRMCTHVDYVVDLQENMASAHELARKNLRKNAERQKRDYDTRINKTTYQEGDLVLCWDKSKVKGKCKKIDPSIWKGPFVIKRKISDLLFEIRQSPTSKTKIVHHDRLQHYNGNRIPDWHYKKLQDTRTFNKSRTNSKSRHVHKHLGESNQQVRKSQRNQIAHRPFQYPV